MKNILGHEIPRTHAPARSSFLSENPSCLHAGRNDFRFVRHACVAALALATAALTVAHDDSPPGATVNPGNDRVIRGENVRVGQSTVNTWAVLTRTGKIAEVGITIPIEIFESPPASGDGPLGAIASLKFPDVVQQASFFNHVEVHWNPQGHPSDPSQPNRYRVPHFDLHFYAIPEAVVWGIPALPMPLPAVPPEKLPSGWLPAGDSEPEMGRHSVPASIAQGPFVADMLAGFLPSGGQMHFVEPMITREHLLKLQSFEMPVPRPAVFGRAMAYPEKFAVEYDAKLRSYHFVFRQFVTVE
jgi:hypothetical protein